MDQRFAADGAPWRVDDSTPPEERERLFELYVTAGVLSRAVPLVRLVDAVRNHARGTGWRALYAATLHAVQLLPLVYDPPGQEILQGPLLTLARGGDCDKKAVVGAIVLRRLGIPARVKWLSLPGEDYNHAALLAGPRGAELWGETTLRGALPGEHPLEASRRLGGSLGPAPRARYAPAGLVPAAPAGWVEYSPQGAPWVQWVQLQPAGAWFAEAARRFAALEGVDKAPYPEQRAAVRDAFTALGLGYRALDLPPIIDPVFRVATLDLFGQLKSRTFDAAAAQRFDPGTSVGAQRTPDGPRAREIDVRMRAQWARLGKSATDYNVHPRNFAVRMWLDQAGTVVENCAGNPFEGAQGDCAFVPGLGAYVGCAYDGQASEGCNPYDWATINWHDPPRGLGAVEPAWRFLAPLRWFGEWGRAIAQACAARGAAEVLTQGRLFQVVTNARNAIAAGLVTGGTPDERALIEAATMIPADTVRARYDNPDIRRAGSTIAAVGALASRANPAIGAALQVTGAVVGALPSAVGLVTDDLGRATPVYERAWIAQRAGGPPPYSIPAAPASSAAGGGFLSPFAPSVGTVLDALLQHKGATVAGVLEAAGARLGPDTATPEASGASSGTSGATVAAVALVALGTAVALARR